MLLGCRLLLLYLPIAVSVSIIELSSTSNFSCFVISTVVYLSIIDLNILIFLYISFTQCIHTTFSMFSIAPLRSPLFSMFPSLEENRMNVVNPACGTPDREKYI